MIKYQTAAWTRARADRERRRAESPRVAPKVSIFMMEKGRHLDDLANRQDAARKRKLTRLAQGLPARWREADTVDALIYEEWGAVKIPGGHPSLRRSMLIARAIASFGHAVEITPKAECGRIYCVIRITARATPHLIQK